MNNLDRENIKTIHREALFTLEAYKDHVKRFDEKGSFLDFAKGFQERHGHFYKPEMVIDYIKQHGDKLEGRSHKRPFYETAHTQTFKQFLVEGTKSKARWQPTTGPNRVSGYELQVPSKTIGWSTVGFIMTDKPPKMSGTVKLYHGASGKEVTANLDDYDFHPNQLRSSA